MRMLYLVACAWPMLCAPSPATVREAAGSFVFKDPVLKKSVNVYYYTPQRPVKLLFLMHGHTRNAKYHRDAWQKFASIHRYVLVAPEFAVDAWSANAYNLGGMRAEASEGPARRRLPKEEWTFSVIERLFDHVRETFHFKGERYSIVGNSAGGQFTHRMALHLPEARFDKAIATNPATYTFFDDTIRWPWGFLRIPITDETIQQALTKNVTLIVGENDTDLEGVPTHPEAMQQGKNRLDRALNFRKSVEAKCKEKGWTCQWRFLVAPKANHGDVSIRPHIEKELLREPSERPPLRKAKGVTDRRCSRPIAPLQAWQPWQKSMWCISRCLRRSSDGRLVRPCSMTPAHHSLHSATQLPRSSVNADPSDTRVRAA